MDRVEAYVVVIRQQGCGNLLLRLVPPEPLQGGLISTRKLRPHAQGGLKKGHRCRVEQVVQMRATRVDAAVATVVQEHAGEPKNRLEKLTITV